MWAKFETLEEFNLWHDAIKIALGFPLADSVSTEYTKAILVSDGSYSAYVDIENSEGLLEGIEPQPVRPWA